MIDLTKVNERFDDVTTALTEVNEFTIVADADELRDFTRAVNELRGALVRLDGAITVVLADLVRRESLKD